MDFFMRGQTSEEAIAGMLRETLPWIYRDRVLLTNAMSADQTLFQEVPGSGGKTEYDTNMDGRGGVLPANTYFLILAFRLKFGEGATLVDAQDIATKTLVKFEVDGKRKWELPIGYFPAGGGIHLQCSQTLNNTERIVVQNGAPDARNIFSYEPSDRVILEPGVPFKVTYRFSSALSLGASTYLEMGMEGRRNKRL